MFKNSSNTKSHSTVRCNLPLTVLSQYSIITPNDSLSVHMHIRTYRYHIWRHLNYIFKRLISGDNIFISWQIRNVNKQKMYTSASYECCLLVLIHEKAGCVIFVYSKDFHYFCLWLIQISWTRVESSRMWTRISQLKRMICLNSKSQCLKGFFCLLKIYMH